MDYDHVRDMIYTPELRFVPEFNGQSSAVITITRFQSPRNGFQKTKSMSDIVGVNENFEMLVTDVGFTSKNRQQHIKGTNKMIR